MTEKWLLKLCIIFSTLVTLNSYATTCTGNDYLNYPEQYQIAYVAGIFDTLEVYDSKLAKCLGTQVKMSQLSDSLKFHLKNNPQFRHYHCVGEFKKVLNEQWKCKK